MKHWIVAAAVLLGSAAQAQTDATLADLIQAGDRSGALELLRLGANVNAPQGDGTTALHWAVYKVDPELVAQLLSREADPNVVNQFGSTPLAEAVKIANAEIVRQLLNAGAEPDARNQDNQTALMLAAHTGVTEVAQLLVAAGADVNAIEQWRGQSALMWAAADNFPEIAELLIEAGANVQFRASSFDWGSQITSEPRGQYRPTGGLTPLLYAARGGCQRCVELMLEQGADINLPDPDGVTPLMVAIDNQHYDLAQYLLQRGANPHLWDWWGRTALYIAADMNSYGSGFGEGAEPRSTLTALDMLRLLLEAGVNPDPQLNMHRPGRGGNSGRFVDDLLNSGATPLLRAANSQDAAAVEVLLEHGALADLPNAMGVTPLIAAGGFGSARGVLGGRFNGNVEPRAIATLELLLAHGADINRKITDTTSKTARIARRSSMTDRQGQTVLFGAISQGWLDVTKYLLAHGAAVSITDDLGKTPMDAAMGKAGGRVDRPIDAMVTLLQEAGIK
jgi:ankyrin repeat protein